MRIVRGPWPGTTQKLWSPPLSGPRRSNFSPFGIPNYSGTSNTCNNLISIPATKTFQTQSGLAYTPGLRLRITSTTSSVYMEGVVVSYSGTTLVINVDTGSGSFFTPICSWTINLAPPPSPPSTTGTTIVVFQAWF